MTTPADKVEKCFPRHVVQGTRWKVLGQSAIEWLNSVVVCRAFDPGSDVFHEGDECRGVHFVREGEQNSKLAGSRSNHECREKTSNFQGHSWNTLA